MKYIYKITSIIMIALVMLMNTIQFTYSATELDKEIIEDYEVNEPVTIESNLFNSPEIQSLDEIEDEIDIANLETITTDDVEVDSIGTQFDDIEITLDENFENLEAENGKVVYEYDDYELEENNIEGGVQYLYTIEDENAPHSFDLDIKIEDGNTLKYNELGEIYIENQEGYIVTLIGSPWAVDSEGNFVETTYVINDNKIVQNVNYSGDSYPLQADPLFCDNTINNTASKMKDKDTFAAVPTKCARAYNISMSQSIITANFLGIFAGSAYVKDAWGEVYNDNDYRKNVASKYNARMKDQFICHAINPATVTKSSWNLDTNRPDVSLWSTYKKACNP